MTGFTLTVMSEAANYHTLRGVKGDQWLSNIGTCKASWFDSISNRTSDSRFDSYWWSDSKFSNRPRRQPSFVKKRLVVV